MCKFETLVKKNIENLKIFSIRNLKKSQNLYSKQKLAWI